MNNTKQKYINSALLLLFSSILVKAISAVYKIPLTAYIGATGRGYFNIAYNLYMPVHALIMGAFPIAVTHLVSKYNENCNHAKIYSLKKASGILFFFTGLIGFAFMAVFAKPYAELISSSPKSIYTIYMLAPSVLFCAMEASKRSLAEGYMNMVPTSVSQIIEAVFKLVFGLLFARYSMSYLYQMYLDSGAVFGVVCANEEAALSSIYPFTAAAAMGGATFGSFFSLIYVSVYNSVKYNSRIPNRKYKTSDTLKEIISFSAPIIVSTIIQSASTFLDNSSVQYCLAQCNLDKLKEAYESCLQITSTPDEDIVTYIFGLFSSAQDFKNLLPGLAMALGVAAVPAISAAFESHNKERLSVLSNSIFKYTSILAFGGGFYLSLISPFLLKALYGTNNPDIVIGCNKLVYFFGFTMIFYCLSSVAVFSVQAIGCAKKSIPSFVVSACVRVGINYLLVSDYRYNLYGTVVSGAAGYFVILASNYYIFKKHSGVKFKFSDIFIKPIICSVLSFLAANVVLGSVFSASGSLLNFVVLSTVYFIFFTLSCILSKLITFSEIKFIQSSKKMA
ncbi:MAG: polysaccharide biosynthesis C-terminal domain-containing protein [Eubacterium sp.]|nr:polysaccharide biosynthesis C-terminal domain-containing protein [Eubacterium sp.]